ncbi:hypothetical protein XU19_11990 [Vibrio parahaemolyticus]|nr:hypothetical protein XU19_11990 [Vibrio parahaemolyticus]KOP91994.1 hypothetical protein AL012_20990 [Citrobacter amalonaticus]KKY43845.1 hypothetical protein AAY51_05335 [Vibrio parahaemolyticus]KOP94368.1 hypothetical protein ALC61_16620 [Citrobacter amalonaticus]OUE58225.1 hypothetical protein AZ012_002472 [Citrobacter amalonaticus]
MFILKFFWVSISFIILIFTLYFYDGTKNSDIEIFLSYSMFLLTFPSGLIILSFLSGIIYLIALMFDSRFEGFEVNRFYLIIEWFIFFFIGYIQWFFVTPFFHRKITKR